MSKSFTIILAVVAVIVLVVAVLSIIRPLPYGHIGECCSRLRQIESAKQDWAVEQHKTTNDMPTWSDLYPHLYMPHFTNRWFANGVPVCPDGGTYTLGRVGQSPTCSLGDKLNHKLP
jgi:hypothetical protein